MMYGLVVVAAVASPGWPQEPPAWMGDALAFRMPPEVARCNWNLACKHPATVRDELYGWNTADALGEWQAECDWRRAVWDKADDIWFCRISPERKWHSLQKLRELLGDEAFFSGWLPAPIPHYRRTPLD